MFVELKPVTLTATNAVGKLETFVTNSPSCNNYIIQYDYNLKTTVVAALDKLLLILYELLPMFFYY